MTPTDEDRGFAVLRIDPRGELPPSYLRSFALAGRNGLQRLAFGGRAAAYVFDSRADAEDIARRLRRRVSGAQYEYRVEAVTREASAASSDAEPALGADGETQ